ncbi:MAG TPA: hypothetical protein VJ891_18750, partial [Casimicrobiaceae bacterium]|nr:hypothetical protein [Casimicrobiaceae bacterium]
TPDFTLAGKLSALRDAAMAARDAVRADPAETQDAPRYVAIALIEQTLDACRQLDATIRAFKPTVFLYTVPARVHLAKLAHQFYGKDGLARITEIQTNNPGQLTDPHAIAPGTQLWMALPTV